MDCMVFPTRFVRWVIECVYPVSYSLMINGELTPCFDAARGLQGDPMSPFLYVIVMEYLSRNLKELGTDTQFKHHPKCQKLDITYLSFVDDLLMFVKGDLASVSLLHEKFAIFTAASRLQANLTRSAIYYGGVESNTKSLIQNVVGSTQGALPFKYFGIPLDTKKLSLLQWQPLNDTVVAKITSWTAKKLSYAGRIQLV
ncbi:uncharacterized protein LOC129900187 [Solanum dulcamara]|uniref:uncharacterized protein LOC129900187 n=1 Tax=Solanum dulcamara TaxID=45834 RepID=UPI002485E3E8|nr:uncharacterized protein LOC129900187 [Solanum dulcamara]